MHNAPERGKHAGGTGVCANVGGHLSRPFILQVRKEDLARRLLAHGSVTGIAHHADDFDVCLGAWISTHSDVPPDGIAIAEIVASKLLIDDGHFRGSQDIALAEIASREHWYAQCLKETRGYIVHVGVHILARFCAVALYGDGTVPLTESKRRYQAQRR